MAKRIIRPRGASTYVVVLVLLLAVVFFSDACVAVESASWRGRLGCGAHRGKSWLIALVLVLLVACGICWLFGVLLTGSGNLPGNRQQAMLRANLRSAIFDCMVRSRYVLLALALLAGLTVIMDQSRDVIASAASSVPRIFDRFTGGGQITPPGAGADRYASVLLFLGSMLIFLLSALALALLGRLVPSGICRTPGCGFMSRGAWFEQVRKTVPCIPAQGRQALSASTLSWGGLVWLHHQ